MQSKHYSEQEKAAVTPILTESVIVFSENKKNRSFTVRLQSLKPAGRNKILFRAWVTSLTDASIKYFELLNFNVIIYCLHRTRIL